MDYSDPARYALSGSAPNEKLASLNDGSGGVETLTQNNLDDDLLFTVEVRTTVTGLAFEKLPDGLLKATQARVGSEQGRSQGARAVWRRQTLPVPV